MSEPHQAERPPVRIVTAPRKEYRCRGCRKVFFEAVKVMDLSKRCPRCKRQNIFDE